MSEARSSTSRWVKGVGVFSVLCFLVLVARFWDPVYGFTRFIQLDSSNDETKISAFKTFPIYVYRNTGGYDGLYYAQIAYDPLLLKTETITAVDDAGYRARRILGPAVSWLVSFGNPAWIVHVYSLLNVVAWLALALLLWRLVGVDTLRGLLAWGGILFSAGAMGSVRYALTDLLALLMLAGAMFAQERGRPRPAMGLLALAALARETAVLALPGICRRPWISWTNLWRGLGAVLPLVAWLIYLRSHLASTTSGWGNFTLPLTGVIEKWVVSWHYSLHGRPEFAILAWTTLFATVGITVQAVYFFVLIRTRDPWWWVGAAYAGLLCFLGTPVWEDFPGAAFRVLLPLTLAFNVSVARARVHWLWLILGNLTIGAGIFHLVEVPYDPQEIAIVRSGASRFVGTLNGGWFGTEHTFTHHWSWSSGRGLITFTSWPRQSMPVSVMCQVRSSKPCTLTISCRNKILWQEKVGAQLVTARFSFPLEKGQAQLEFSSDQTPLPESSEASARNLAFAVYDVKISPLDPAR